MEQREPELPLAPAADGAVEGRQASRGRNRSSLTRFLLLPALVFLAIFFAYPMIDIVMRSFAGPGGFTLAHYGQVIEHPVYLRVFQITFEIAFTVTLLTLLLGYPLAYVLAGAGKLAAGAIMACVLLSFFTNILVRTYAWMIILGPEGVINQLLRYEGLGSVKLLYNRYGVLIGMTYALLPYMVLTLYSVMSGIDRRFLQAARNLGASDWRAFWHVFLPLSLPGVVGGSLLVFILSVGYFITPRLLGGARDQMIAMVIEQHVELGVNWGFASALAIILLVLTTAGFMLYDRLVGLKSLFESKA
ncbi:MAG TPA: ABC transporter permease [Alphaproteobacteria bacterium]|nr:ABC transporter permease [Alphaproteobacteria bacterium]